MGKQRVQEESEEFSFKTPPQTPKKKVTRRGRPPYMSEVLKLNEPAIYAESYEPLTDLDLCIYLEAVHENKLIGMSLVDQYGKFYLLSKSGCEHMEASLNNFQIQSLFDIVVSLSRNKLLKKFKNPVYKTMMKATIYSKNNKRKWPKDSHKEGVTVEEMYYKYLKTIIFQIRPIRLENILSEEDFDALFQDEFIVRKKELLSGSKKLFMIESRLSSEMQNFDKSLLNDPVLKKFIEKGIKKHRGKEITLTDSNRKSKSQMIEEESEEIMMIEEKPAI